MFFMFSIIGVQLWSGLFEGVCHVRPQLATNGTANGYNGTWEIDSVDGHICELAFASGSGCDSVTTTCRPVYNGQSTVHSLVQSSGLFVCCTSKSPR